MKIWGHNELQEDLADHLRSNTDRLVWTNIQMGPSGTYRPDVFCIPKSYAHFHPVTYEVKVSLNDFRSDITSGKWQSYLNVSQAVIFAMPAGFINKQDVPTGCGLIIRYESGWKMVKKPTMQLLDTLPRDAWLKLLMTGIDRESRRLNNNLQMFDRYKAEKAIAKKFGAEIAQLIADQGSAKQRLELAIASTNASIEAEKENRKKKIEAMRSDEAIYGELKKELCDFLGLPFSTQSFVMQNKVRNLIDSLSKDQEIERLNRVIGRIKTAVDEALTTEVKFDNVARKAA